MATKQELQDQIDNLKAALSMVANDDTLKNQVQAEIDDLEQQLSAMGNQPAPQSQPMMPQPQGGDMSQFYNTLLSSMSTLMQSGQGSGIDYPALREFIKKYLDTDKIKLSELDNEVLEEIKKNQIKYLNIPNFSKKIEITSAMSRIPNFYDIIDDILAGNNVYLIGEAGGGKTYTAEMVSKTLQRDYVTLNCSQYTSPLEVLGGQSVEGFKQGKLIDCWKNGKILILDEMPKLDANTAGLFNDALAKSSKTRKKSDAKINSANPDEAPIERADDFAVIATGNIYPNQPPPPQYRGNNQQDLSLLDRFSGSVYYTEFDNNTDEDTTRFKFIYEFLVGNYYKYIDAKKKKDPLPTPKGLRTIIDANSYKNLALVSYRTNISFRVAFEFELVREIARRNGQLVEENGKTFLKTFQSYMVAFRETTDAYDKIIRETSYSDAYVNNLVKSEIDKILKDPENGFLNSLNPLVKESASKVYDRYKDFYVGEAIIKP